MRFVPVRAAGAALRIVTLAALVASCSRPAMTGNPDLVDPEKVSKESGSTEEIYAVSQNTVNAFLDCPSLERSKRYRIVLDRIVNSTGIADYDDRVFYNRLLSQLIQNAGGRFTFLDRHSVLEERSAQAGGEVESTGPLRQLRGADLVMRIELIGLEGAGSKTVQYDIKLVTLDGEIQCVHTEEIKKRA